MSSKELLNTLVSRLKAFVYAIYDSCSKNTINRNNILCFWCITGLFKRLGNEDLLCIFYISKSNLF